MEKQVYTCTQALQYACQVLDVTHKTFSGVGSHACRSPMQEPPRGSFPTLQHSYRTLRH